MRISWWNILAGLAIWIICLWLTIIFLGATELIRDAEGAIEPISPITPPPAYEQEQEGKGAPAPDPTVEPYQDSDEWCIVNIPLMGRGLIRCEDWR